MQFAVQVQLCLSSSFNGRRRHHCIGFCIRFLVRAKLTNRPISTCNNSSINNVFVCLFVFFDSTTEQKSKLGWKLRIKRPCQEVDALIKHIDGFEWTWKQQVFVMRVGRRCDYEVWKIV